MILKSRLFGFIDDLELELIPQTKMITIRNAGVGARMTIDQMTEAVFDNLFNIHFKGVYFLTQKRK